jgi:hypothetical protein
MATLRDAREIWLVPTESPDGEPTYKLNDTIEELRANIGDEELRELAALRRQLLHALFYEHQMANWTYLAIPDSEEPLRPKSEKGYQAFWSQLVSLQGQV